VYSGQAVAVSGMVVALLARASVVEGCPAMDKTLAVKRLRWLGVEFQRTSTPDHGPADIAVTSIYNETRPVFDVSSARSSQNCLAGRDQQGTAESPSAIWKQCRAQTAPSGVRPTLPDRYWSSPETRSNQTVSPSRKPGHRFSEGAVD